MYYSYSLLSLFAFLLTLFSPMKSKHLDQRTCSVACGVPAARIHGGNMGVKMSVEGNGAIVPLSPSFLHSCMQIHRLGGGGVFI